MCVFECMRVCICMYVYVCDCVSCARVCEKVSLRVCIEGRSLHLPNSKFSALHHNSKLTADADVDLRQKHSAVAAVRRVQRAEILAVLHHQRHRLACGERAKSSGKALRKQSQRAVTESSHREQSQRAVGKQ